MMRPFWRRLPYAVFWLGVVSLVMVGATGWSSAKSDGPADLESETWRLGDAGAYSMVLTGDWAYDGRSEGEPLPGPRFEAAAIEEIVAADGDWAEAMRVLWSGPAYGLDGPWSERTQVWWLDPDRRVMRSEASTDQVTGGILQDDTVRHASSRTYSPDGLTDCLLQPPWGAGPLPVACEVTGFGMALPAGTPVEEVGHHMADGIRLLHLRAEHDDERIEWWMAPGAPAAWRVEASASTAGQERTATFTLERFQRGAGEALQGGTWPGVSTHWAARQPWGPAETGIDHPFSAATAYDAAMRDPTFTGMRDWLRDHPGGYVFMTSYAEEQDDQGARHTWTLHLSDGEEGYSIRVSDEQRLGLLPGGTTTREIATHHLADDAPAIDALPGLMPTVRSMWDRWSMQADQEPNAWGMRILADAEGQAVVEYTAGHVASLQWGPGGVSMDPVAGSADERSLAAFDGDGRMMRLDSQQQGGSDDDHAPNSAQPWTPASMSLVGRSWQWPDPARGAGIGVAAVVVATLYLAWPAAKAAGVGLFSRIHGPQLLEHPTRQAVMDAVRGEPGIHFGALTQCIGAPPGQIRHHVRKLVDGRLIVERRSPGYTCYFLYRGTSRTVLEAAPVLRAPGARQLMSAMAASPGSNARDLAKSVGISPATATYHLQRLQQAGMVDAQRQGRSLSLRLTPEGESATGAIPV